MKKFIYEVYGSIFILLIRITFGYFTIQTLKTIWGMIKTYPLHTLAINLLSYNFIGWIFVCALSAYLESEKLKGG